MVNTGQDGVTFDCSQCRSQTDQRAAMQLATANSALGYAYQNAGAGRVVFDDVSHVAETGFGTRVAVNVNNICLRNQSCRIRYYKLDQGTEVHYPC